MAGGDKLRIAPRQVRRTLLQSFAKEPRGRGGGKKRGRGRGRGRGRDRKSTRLNSSHGEQSRMPSSA